MVALAVLVRGLVGYIGVQVFTTFYPANGFVLVDENGMIRLVNASAEKLFGYRREELVGRPVELLVPEHYLTEHRKVRAAYQGRPEVRMMGIGRDLSGRRQDGSEFPVEIGLNPVGQEKRSPSHGDGHFRGAMSDDDEIQSYFDMDEAFCARMRMAIEAGLESAPIGVITTPRTRKPKYVLTEYRPLASSQGDMNF